jgi:PII interaction protein X
MTSETYLNHPTFGLLFSLCLIEQNRTLFTTLYAQRLFFMVSSTQAGLEFESINRNEAKLIVENRLRTLRRSGILSEYDHLKVIHKQTFQ